MKRCLTALFALVLCTLAYAHKPSDSYLTLSQQEAAPQLHMQWDIAIRDLDMALGLDHDLDGKVTWGELQAAEARLQSYAFEHLRVNAGGQVCVPLYRGLQVDKHVDGMYAVINAELSCAAADSYQVDYSLLFEFDRLHKGIVTLKQGASNQVAIASADQHTVTIKANGTGLIKQLGQFVKEGVWHIWIGFDHILFLISLLIPAVMILVPQSGRAAGWQPADALKPVLKDAIGIVTAFTVAHSITLCLAALDIVRLPSRLVESAIAVSVLLAALNNLYPLVHRRRWLVTFAFGLIHGFGFASALAELDLGRGSLLASLFGFNLGVELGQLAIVVGFLPLAFWLRQQLLYRRFVLQGGSFAIALISLGWFGERAFDMRLLPF